MKSDEVHEKPKALRQRVSRMDIARLSGRWAEMYRGVWKSP